MSLHNLKTTVTPEEVAAIETLVQAVAARLKDKVLKREELTPEETALMEAGNNVNAWVAAQHDALYEAWAALPQGSHLKQAYADQVWTWSDRDLAEEPEAPDEDLSFAPPVRPE